MGRIITIDVRMLNFSGIGTYLKNVLPIIIESSKNCTYNLLGSSTELKNNGMANFTNVNIVNVTSKIYSIAEQIEIYKKIPNNTQLFWAPHYNIPILYRGRLLVTIHDVFHLSMPQFVCGIDKRLYARFMFNRVRRQADAIITVSNFTKNELIKFTNCNADKIFPIYNGVNSNWFNPVQDDQLVREPYIIYVGNVKPHKNLVMLLRAFEMIKNEIPHKLFIVGKKDGFIIGDKKVFEFAKTLGDRVLFTGYVDDEKLQKYVAGASCMVFPSLYEGFGLPPIEAMACGCPVAVSEAASLPEICGTSVLYFNPYDINDIANKILCIVNSKEVAAGLRNKGIAYAKQFSWTECARKTMDVLAALLQNE